MKLKIGAITLLVGMAFMTAAPAVAAAPTVTKVYRTYNSYNYTVNVTDPATSVSASPTQGNPITSGGCVNQYKRKANGQQLYIGTACLTPGTVRFTTPDFPVCETPFNIAVNGATIYTDSLNSPCPPPPPPAVTTTVTADSVTFTNPASVAQQGSYGRSVPSLACTYTGDSGFITQTSTRYSGVGPNTYVYYWAFVFGSVPANTSVVLTLVCP